MKKFMCFFIILCRSIEFIATFILQNHLVEEELAIHGTVETDLFVIVYFPLKVDLKKSHPLVQILLQMSNLLLASKRELHQVLPL